MNLIYLTIFLFLNISSGWGVEDSEPGFRVLAKSNIDDSPPTSKQNSGRGRAIGGVTKEDRQQQNMLVLATKEALKGSNFTQVKSATYADLTNDLETWEPPAELKAAFPYYHSGYDDEDRPIWISELGRYNLRKIVDGGGVPLENMEKYATQAAYFILKSINERSTPERPVTEGMFLVDMEGLEFSQFTSIPTLRKVLNLCQKFSALIINHIGISTLINANYWGETFITMLRPLLGRAGERVEIYGTRKDRWLPVLNRRFPPESLPEWYGGIKNFKPVQVYG